MSAAWSPIYSVAISPDWQHVAVGRGHRIHVYHLPMQKLVAKQSIANNQ